MTMKYKLTALILAAAMLAPTLAACGKNKSGIVIDETSTEENLSAKKTDVTTTAEESTTAVTTTAATTAPASTAAPTTTAPTTAAPTTAAPVTAAPTTAAPVTEPPTEKTRPTASQVASAVAAKSSLFDEALVESTASRGLTLFGIDASEVAEAAYYAASAAVADEILVVQLASGASASSIRSDFEGRQAVQAEDYEDYVPSEVPKINNAVIYQNGDIMVFCVSNDASAVRSTLDSLF